MTILITIANPLLITGQYFKVEYSTDGQTWTFDSYQNSNSFNTTYNGFTAGNTYYFRFTVVKSLSPLVECDSVIRVYTIPSEAEWDCLDFSAEITPHNITHDNLKISYTIPSPYVAPCGGYIMRWGKSYPLSYQQAYTSLPASPINFIINKGTYIVEIYAVDCEGNEYLCFQDTVVPEEPDCTPASLVSVTIDAFGSTPNITIVFNAANPKPTSYAISYTQCGGAGSLPPDPGGTFNFTATSNNPETVVININPAIGYHVITYCGSISDGCGGSIPFDKSHVG